MIDRILAGGVAGLGQGITEQAKQRGLMQREQALQRMRAEAEAAVAQRDRGWQLEDAETKRSQELEDRESDRAFEIETADAKLKRDKELAEFEAGLPARPRSGSSSSDPDGTAMTREVEYLAGVLANSRGEELSDKHRLDAVQLRRASSVDAAAQDRARNTIFDALMEDRRDKRTIQEKWDEAGRMAGISGGDSAPSPSSSGLGAGLEGDEGPGDEPPASAPSRGSASAAEPPPAGADGIPRPKSREEYDALPSGAVYMAPDGTVRTKP